MLMWVLLISSLLMATALMVVVVVVVVPLAAPIIALIRKVDSFLHNLLYFQLITL